MPPASIQSYFKQIGNPNVGAQQGESGNLMFADDQEQYSEPSNASPAAFYGEALAGISDDDLAETEEDEFPDTLAQQAENEGLAEGRVDIGQEATDYLATVEAGEREKLDAKLVHYMGKTAIARDNDIQVDDTVSALQVYRYGIAGGSRSMDEIQHTDPVALSLSPEEYRFIDMQYPDIPPQES